MDPAIRDATAHEPQRFPRWFQFFTVNAGIVGLLGLLEDHDERKMLQRGCLKEIFVAAENLLFDFELFIGEQYDFST
jgi:hypothetical protein